MLVTNMVGNKMMRHVSGFTLAEVLITLGIIGIVASMTIPTLIERNQKQIQVTQMKSFYSNLSNGLKNYMVKQGCTDLPCTGIFDGDRDSGTWNTNIATAMRNTFKIMKSCSNGVSGCGEYTRYLDKTPYINSTFDLFTYGASFITSDGKIFMVYDTDPGNCTGASAITTSSKLKNYCATVYVDVNGLAKPGIWGRDLFQFFIARDGSVYPAGGIETAKITQENYTVEPSYWKNNTTCGTPGSEVIPAGAGGTNCSARIMDNDWVMDY